MRIVGVFLNPEVRTGGHRRYLEFFQAIADIGHEAFLILNKNLKYTFDNLNEIRIDYNYRKKIIPYSLVSMFTVKRNINTIIESVKACDYIVVFGETHLMVSSYLKKVFKARLLFSLRSNGVVEARIKRKEADVRILEKIKLVLSEYKYRYYESLFGRKSDIIVFQSNFDRDSFLSRNPEFRNKSIVIPGNIGGDRFHPRFKDTNKSKRLRNIFFIGAVSTRKGIKYLVYAVTRLIKDGCDINLSIAGDGGLREELQQYVYDNDIGNRVSFLGKINNVMEQLSKADLLVVPSIFDSYPNVILESLHVGTPVIAANSGGIQDMLEDSDLFEPSNEGAIYKILSRLYNDVSAYCSKKDRLIGNRQKFYFDWAQLFIDAMSNELYN